MSIQPDSQQTQGDADRSIHEQETIIQTMGSPTPLPYPPPQPPHKKRERWLIASALIVVLVLVLALGGVFAAQLGNHPIVQATPTPTVAVTPTPASTGAVTPTAAPTAGVTPTTAPPGPPAQINALWMSDASTGWARTTTQLILRTSNGGHNWQDVTPPYPARSAGQLPPAFAFLNGTTAWVAVSERQQSDGTFPTIVFRTSDAGHSWQEALLPTSQLGVSQVQFVNARDGWVLSSFGGGAAGSQAADLFHSTDGGQTWSIVSRAPGAFPLHGIKSGMSWISPTTGWVTGSIAIPNTALLYRTQDAGVSWQQQSLPLPSPLGGLTTQPPVFFSATEGLLPATFTSSQGQNLVIYTTHDGGATWRLSTTLSSAGSVWDFLTMQQGWAVGANGTTLDETSDGGLHWTSMTPGTHFQHISQLDFVSTHEGWAISTATAATPALLQTTDGGQTWVQVSYNRRHYLQLS